MRLRGVLFLVAVINGLQAQGPLDAPPELLAFARQTMAQPPTVRAKLEALLSAVFTSTDPGRPPMAYGNDRTRTVSEAWRERRANCLSLTALFVSSCRAAGLEVQFAEVLNVNRWQRSGSTIRFERHLVALVKASAHEDLVADFMPAPRRRTGNYIVALLSRDRVLALFHSNRAVELMEAAPEAALAEARRSLDVDPRSAIGWNIQGVVLGRMGRSMEAEASFRRALALEAKDGVALGNLELLLREAGRQEEADHYRKLGHEIRKKDPYFRAALAQEALEAGNLKGALKHAKASVKLNPQDADLLLILARVRLAMGDPEAALKALEKAKKLSTPEEQARFENKMAIIRRGRMEP